MLGYIPEVILAGRKINDSIGKYIADKVIDKLKSKCDDFSELVVTILGVTFKENISDIRNTKVLDIINELKKHSLQLQIYDPYADSDFESQHNLKLTEFSDLKKSDIIILAVPHKNFIKEGWQLVTKLTNTNGSIVFDIKSILDRNYKPQGIELVRF